MRDKSTALRCNREAAEQRRRRGATKGRNCRRKSSECDRKMNYSLAGLKEDRERAVPAVPAPQEANLPLPFLFKSLSEQRQLSACTRPSSALQHNKLRDSHGRTRHRDLSVPEKHVRTPRDLICHFSAAPDLH